MAPPLFTLSTETNAKAFRLHLKEIEKQVKFAQARTLTQVAEFARKDQRAHVLDTFTKRNAFTTKGVRRGAKGPGGIGVTRAEKKDKVPFSEVFHGEGTDFFSLHETGGTLKPRGNRLVVPLKGTRRPNRRKKIIPLAKRPRALLLSPLRFIMTLPDDRELIVGKRRRRRRPMSRKLRVRRRRQAKKGRKLRKRRESRGLIFFYAFEKNRLIDAGLELEATVLRAMKVNTEITFKENVNEAFKSAKKTRDFGRVRPAK